MEGVSRTMRISRRRSLRVTSAGGAAIGADARAIADMVESSRGRTTMGWVGKEPLAAAAPRLDGIGEVGQRPEFGRLAAGFPGTRCVLRYGHQQMQLDGGIGTEFLPKDAVHRWSRWLR